MARLGRRTLLALGLVLALACGSQASRDDVTGRDEAKDGVLGFASETLAETVEEQAKAPVKVGPSVAKQVAAEFLAMFLFVVIGCGSAMGIAKEAGSAWILQVSLTFGLAITSLAYSIGHISGGHINCAVTIAFMLERLVEGEPAGKDLGTCGAIIVAQLLGSLAGALFLCGMYPKGKDLTGGLGSNGVGEGWSYVNAFLGEMAMTALLIFVVFETAYVGAAGVNACIAIGFAVFLAHSVLIPIDGCSINPTRSTGPALVAKFYCGAETLGDLWLFWLGPVAGSALGWGMYRLLHHAI